ncbi:MAG: DegV family protein [Coriobacteriia bacterium]|nr:DegV family protein [Coriobacteriia bacterium]
MPSFAVVTDSTADIAADMAAERNITVVPLSVLFGEESFTDGVLSQAEFFERMVAAPSLPTTSTPSIGAFVEAYERALQTAESVVSVHISHNLSGTIGAATQAAEQFAGRVHVFDSLNLSWGLAWQVMDAARSAAEGLSAQAALDRLALVRERVKLIVGLDSLENLSRGGRIGKVGAFLGAMLKLKVTFTVDSNGEFLPLERSRGEKAALAYTMDWVAQQMGEHRRGRFAVGQALSLERANEIAQWLRERYTVDELVIYETGSVISTHTGTGWGVAVLPSE